MEPKTKKYMIYGGVAAAGVLFYYRWKHEDKIIGDTKKKLPHPKFDAALSASQAPLPSTASQFSPVAFNPYPPVGYQPQYPTTGYPQPYPYQPQYPVNGYPATPPFGYNPVTSPYGGNCQVAAQSVIGLSAPVARQRLLSVGVQSQVVSINGRPLGVALLGGSTVSLYLSGGIVQAASCQSQSQIYPAAY